MKFPMLRDSRLLFLTISSLLIAGLFSFFALPRMEDPVLTERAAMVNTRVPGASARRVESLVTEKIVEKIREFDEVKEVRSTSRANISTVIITLADEIAEVDEVWARVRDKVSDTRAMLPSDALAPEFDIIRVRAFASILGLAWKSDREPVYSVLRRTAKDLEDAIRNIANTEKVESFGEPQEEIIVEVQQTELAAMGISIADLAGQIAASDAKQPAGLMRSLSQELQLAIGGELDSLHRVGRIPVRSQRGGYTSYLSDVATIRKSKEEPPRSEAIIDGNPGVMVAASVLPNARIDYWNSDLQDCVQKFRNRLPPDLELVEVFNQNKYVEARIQYLVRDLIYSAAAVFLVVFLMMGAQSSLVVGLALPLASCIVLVCFRVFDIPLHQMSLSGLVISLGMLEGTAIIIVDEIRRRIQEGEERFEAVRNGLTHMALPLFGSASTTVLSFLPIAIMPGPSGEFVGTIGTSVVMAITASLVLSFSIIPSLTAFLSKPVASASIPNFWSAGVRSRRLTEIYRWSLVLAIRHPLMTFVFGILIALPGFVYAVILPVQFFPSSDRDQLHCEIELSAQASIGETKAVADQVKQILLRDPNILRVDWVLGQSAPSFYYNMIGTRQDSPRFGEALIQTKVVKEPAKLVRDLQATLDREVTNAQIRLLMLEQGPPYNAPIELRITGDSSDLIQSYGEHIRTMLMKIPSVTQTQADMTDMLPRLVYDINEDESRALGIPLVEIARQLQTSLEGSVGGSILEGNEEVPIRVRLARDERSDLPSIEKVDLIHPSSVSGKGTVSLAALGSPTVRAEAATIARFNGNRINEVRAYLKAGVLPSTVLEAVQRELQLPENAPPDGCSIEFGGESSKRTEAVGQLLGNVTLLAASIVFVLVISLRSFRAMAAILGIAVLSFGLAILSLGLTGFPFGFTAIVGAMGMIGIAINDSIVVLAELRSDPRSRKGDQERILELLLQSTRHVLCTTFTVGCSFIPMLLEGGTFWPPMAMVISGGVFGATWLALYWIPAVHLLFWRHRADDAVLTQGARQYSECVTVPVDSVSLPLPA